MTLDPRKVGQLYRDSSHFSNRWFSDPISDYSSMLFTDKTHLQTRTHQFQGIGNIDIKSIAPERLPHMGR